MIYNYHKLIYRSDPHIFELNFVFCLYWFLVCPFFWIPDFQLLPSSVLFSSLLFPLQHDPSIVLSPQLSGNSHNMATIGSKHTFELFS